MKIRLVLEDGKVFEGEGFGKEGETIAEVVFNTSMTGYQEICTDPSYNGQMVAMTYPLIGNYGFNDIYVESRKTFVEGFIVNEICDKPSNWNCSMDAQEYFFKNDIVGIKGVDTRALTQHIRSFGSMWGMISNGEDDVDVLLGKIKEASEKRRNLVMEATTNTPIHIKGEGERVVLLDFGAKKNIIRSLQKRDCDVYVLPANSTFEDVLSYSPDGVLLSNGPGDPADLIDVIDQVKTMVGKIPLFGICLGHQLIGLALGGKTYKMKFGHHGANHPVKDFARDRCFITSQNHNYALENDFSKDIEVTHINVNDKSVEGFRHKKLPIMGVQYHPEACPGPEDSAYIFDDFIKLIG